MTNIARRLTFLLVLIPFAANFDSTTVALYASEDTVSKALGRQTWYDPKADQLKAIPLEPTDIEQANRTSRWDPKPSKSAPTSTNTGGGGTGFRHWAEIASWTLLILLIGSVTALVVYAFLYGERGEEKKKLITVQNREIQGRDESEQGRMEQLPVRVSINTGDLFAEAKRYASTGRFDLAIIYLFSQTLLQLDRKHRIRLALGKTNRQYLRELSSSQDLQSPTNDIVETFESSYFGGHPPTPEQFSECLQRYELIDRRLTEMATTLCVFLVVFCAGCRSDIDDRYGKSYGPHSTTSINGFGGLRQLFADAGWQTRSDYRLSDRLERAKVLIWIPQEVQLPDVTLQQWIDNWLSSQSGRRFIYIHPGYDATSEYLQQAQPKSTPQHRIEYRRRYAKSLIKRVLDQSASEVQTCEWFMVSPLSDVEKSTITGNLIEDSLDAKSELEEAPPVIAVTASLFASDMEISDSDEEFSTEVEFQPELYTDGDDTIVASLTTDHWSDSKMLVLANGSFLVNFALTDPAKRPLVRSLIEDCGDPGRIVFLETTESLTIRPDSEGLPTLSGMEIFTQWPLNIVTMHAAVWGLLTLLALSPIFGRARRLQTMRRTDFGRHLHGIAELLYAVGDVTTARRHLGEYFRQVRNEPDSPWANMADTQSPFAAKRPIRSAEPPAKPPISS